MLYVSGYQRLQQALLNLPSTRLFAFVVHQLIFHELFVLECFRLASAQHFEPRPIVSVSHPDDPTYWSATRVHLISTDCIQLHAVLGLMTYLESCISYFSENSFCHICSASSLTHSGYLSLRTSACGCSWLSAVLHELMEQCCSHAFLQTRP